MERHQDTPSPQSESAPADLRGVLDRVVEAVDEDPVTVDKVFASSLRIALACVIMDYMEMPRIGYKGENARDPVHETGPLV